MDREIAPKVKETMGKRVENWEVPIGFSHYITIDRTGISLYVAPEGEGLRFWVWVSKGVRGHPIYTRRDRSRRDPRYRSALTIYRYRPKTRPGGGFGYSGVRTFVGYAAYIPWWPGIAPRDFEYYSAQELKQWYQRTMENIVRRAVRAANRKALRFWRR